MKIHTEFEQNSLAWLQCRAGKLTASEAVGLVTPLFKIRTGETPETLLYTKLAEAWRGFPVDTFTTKAMEYGHLKEEQAIPFFELAFEEKITRVGFIESDDGSMGCSPDGILPGEMGIEIKCLSAPNHLKILLRGEMPAEYAPQVHFSMMITGWKAWRFLSFCPGYPPFVTLIERDENIQATLQVAGEMFIEKLATAKAKLKEINGGKWPEPKTFFVQQQQQKQMAGEDDVAP